MASGRNKGAAAVSKVFLALLDGAVFEDLQVLLLLTVQLRGSARLLVCRHTQRRCECCLERFPDDASESDVLCANVGSEALDRSREEDRRRRSRGRDSRVQRGFVLLRPPSRPTSCFTRNSYLGRFIKYSRIIKMLFVPIRIHRTIPKPKTKNRRSLSRHFLRRHKRDRRTTH